MKITGLMKNKSKKAVQKDVDFKCPKVLHIFRNNYSLAL